MLRKLLVSALGLALLPAVAQAAHNDSDYGFDPGNWELTLGGGGSNDASFEATTARVNGSIGYFFTDNIELSLRQDLGYSDTGEAGFTGTTRVAADWHFDLGQWQPFIGANVGFTYGQGVHDSWEAAPEAGVKYFVNHTTFIELLAEYQFFFDDGNNDTFSDGAFVYTLALGFKW